MPTPHACGYCGKPCYCGLECCRPCLADPQCPFCGPDGHHRRPPTAREACVLLRTVLRRNSFPSLFDAWEREHDPLPSEVQRSHHDAAP